MSAKRRINQLRSWLPIASLLRVGIAGSARSHPHHAAADDIDTAPIPIVSAEAARALDTAYAWLEQRLAGRHWAAGDRFSMADCAAAPSLFYADWVRPIAAAFPLVRAYRSRLLARPTFARAIEEARPYRGYFPLGAPDRD